MRFDSSATVRAIAVRPIFAIRPSFKPDLEASNLRICRFVGSRFRPSVRKSSSSSCSSPCGPPICISSVTEADGMGCSKGASVKSVWKDWTDSGGWGFDSDGEMDAKGRDPDVAVSACTVICLR